MILGELVLSERFSDNWGCYYGEVIVIEMELYDFLITLLFREICLADKF